MIDKEAIQELSKAQAITAATTAVIGGVGGVVALPNDFSLHDLEKFSDQRRRARGTMSTPILADFAAYVGAHAEAGATVFVNSDAMTALAVLNLGAPQAPGHADNVGRFEPTRTAAFSALLTIADGRGRKQADVAEFFEDWAGIAALEFFSDDTQVTASKAISAVRNITVESARRVESTEKQLGAQRSAFESVQASSADTLPTLVYFHCQPHIGLPQRMFVVRLGVLTGEAKPQVVLRIVNREQHQQEMAAELAEMVRAAFDGDSEIPVVVGAYKVAS